MPSSSSSCGFSSRAVISSNLNASAISLLFPRLPAPGASITVSLGPKTHAEGADAMAYELPDLPYDYAALEPHIDEQTMRIHHDKHHKAYVDNANAALQGT